MNLIVHRQGQGPELGAECVQCPEEQRKEPSYRSARASSHLMSWKREQVKLKPASKQADISKGRRNCPRGLLFLGDWAGGLLNYGCAKLQMVIICTNWHKIVVLQRLVPVNLNEPGTRHNELNEPAEEEETRPPGRDASQERYSLCKLI